MSVPVRWFAIPALVLPLVVGGCDFATDTPLGLKASSHAVKPGEPITGTVRYPDGKITATLAAADGTKTSCSYDDKAFSCPTTAAMAGLYSVSISDADAPDEGTPTVYVAISDIDGYDPATMFEEGVDVGGSFDLTLSGWGANRKVSITLTRLADGEGERDELTKKLSVRTDASGDAALDPIEGLAVGTYSVVVTDGIWTSGNEGGQQEAIFNVYANEAPTGG